MKKLFFTLLFFLAFAGTSYAAANSSLCDASCNLTISFPDGGAITAIEPLTIVFGESGFINDGATTTGYSAGDTVSLAAGESLSFAAGGMLDLGAAGNIEYTSMRIDTSGDIDITAVGGAEQITIQDLELTGGTLTLNSATVVMGLLTISGDMLINAVNGISNPGTIITASGAVELAGSLENTGSIGVMQGASLSLASGFVRWTGAGDTNNWSDPANWQYVESCDATGSSTAASLTISSTGAAPTAADNVCISANALVGWQQSAGCNSASGSYGGGVTISTGATLADPTGCINPANNLVIDPDLSNSLSGTLTLTSTGGGTLTLNDGVDLVNASGTVTAINDFTLVAANLSQQSLSEMEGFKLLTSDGNTCTVTNGECITASGAKYVVNTDGELVPADDGGAINLYLLLMMAMLLFGRYSFLCMRQC